ncbi:hypothetical protein PISMIDRAFT_19458 [Pisolithus microcarpus 441]|uniref:Uncharacterized protein n=1 Tax=Pisolithus microcarpus 441 TaxID=765257 RepID=A0A0C9XGX7_9AGAM|nr:hypothetical protein PISMIDRAFT_19458 [Pisolithus microcarpus 441]
MRERISLVKSGELKPGWGSFSHIVGGYDTGYYGYTHLLVFAAEMYITVFKRGPLDPIIGQLYRSKILLSGGSRDEMDFLCRPPIDAIWESIVVSLETYFGPEGRSVPIQPCNIVKHVKRSNISIEPVIDDMTLSTDSKLLAFGYTVELMLPMVENGKEALGSMGNGAPLPAMATQPRLMYEYFRQLFAQVTNPPIDAIRESIVMSLETYFGPEVPQNLLPSPILTIEEKNAMKNLKHVYPAWPSVTIDITFPKEGLPGYQLALQRVCSKAAQAVEDGVKVIILPDHATGPTCVPLLALVACGGVHHHLVLQKMRAKVALMVETCEAREVHHLCVLVGYDTDAVCLWLMMETIHEIDRENLIKSSMTVDELTTHYRHSIDHGILKVMSRMGISTLQSYKGAQILSLHSEVVERCFIGIASRVQGATFDLLALDTFKLHERGWPTRGTILPPGMPESGEYHWWDGGEAHINDLGGIANLKYAVCEKNRTTYDMYALNANEQAKSIHLHGLLDFRYENAMPIPIEQVEPWNEIVLSEVGLGNQHTNLLQGILISYSDMKRPVTLIATTGID